MASLKALLSVVFYGIMYKRNKNKNMKNTRFKNVIFTAGMAVFTGVLLLGVNAAIGVSAPEVNPSDAVGVSPTFTGLDVQGVVQNTSGNNGGGVLVDDDMTVDGTLNVTGFIQNSGDSSLILEDKVQITGAGNYLTVADSIVSGGSLTVNGPMMNGGGDTVGVQDNMTVNGALNVTGTSNLQGNVSNSNSAFTIDDDLNISGEIGHPTPGEPVTVADDFDVYGSIKNTSTSPTAFTLIELVLPLQRPVTIDDSLVVTGTSNLQGNVSDSGGDFTVGDNLAVTGTSDLRGNVSDSTGEFTIDDDVIITSGNTVINQGALEVWDYAGFASGIHMDLNETQDNNLTGVNDIVLHGEIRDSTATEVTINDGLTVRGAAKANRFGTYYSRMQSTGKLIPKGGGDATAFSMACPVGQTLVSCGIDASGYNVDVLRLYPWDNNTCYAHVRNTDAYDRYAWLVTMCLDPDA